jgi:hypothetical protein
VHALTASGAILGELKLSGPVYGSVATDNANLFVITSGGRLHGVQVVSGRELWTLPVAPNTESTPAVDGGVVYLADQKGTARAVQGADGKLLWSRELGSEFSRCPVVLPELVVFGCMDGRLVALKIVRPGRHVTITAFSRMVGVALAAAEHGELEDGVRREGGCAEGGGGVRSRAGGYDRPQPARGGRGSRGV